uniref:Uncharacterized protein n=1 Tax=Lepeophtheirus salmonis TaxID=72036 RepID=A0A0K2TG76_LEPSM
MRVDIILDLKEVMHLGFFSLTRDRDKFLFREDVSYGNKGKGIVKHTENIL